MSYAAADGDAVNELIHELQRAGIDVWVGRREIQPGTNWAESLRNAIADASAFIFVISERSFQSHHVRAEFRTAESLGKPIIPVVIDEAITEMPAEFRGLLYVDLRSNRQSGIETLVAALKKSLPVERPVETASTDINRGYVFISYADQDREFIARLTEFMSKWGFAFWEFSTSERNYQVQFFLELESVIKESSAVLAILTPAWKESSWTLREYLFAVEVHKPVFLLRLEDFGPTLVIAGIPYIDFVGDWESGFDKLNAVLKKHLAELTP